MPPRTDFTPFGYRINDAIGSLCPRCTHDILVGEGLHPIEARHVLEGATFDIAPLWPVRKVKSMQNLQYYGIATSYEEKYNCVKDRPNDYKLNHGAKEPSDGRFYTLILCGRPEDSLYFPECDNLQVRPLLDLQKLPNDCLLRVKPVGGVYVASTDEDAVQVYFPNVQIGPNMNGPITRTLRRIDPDMSACCTPDELTIAAGDAEEDDEYCNICSKLLMIEFKKRSILGGVDFPALLDAMQEEDPRNLAYKLIKDDFYGLYNRDLLHWYLSHTQRLMGSLHGIEDGFKKRTVYRVLCRVNSALYLELSKP